KTASPCLNSCLSPGVRCPGRQVSGDAPPPPQKRCWIMAGAGQKGLALPDPTPPSPISDRSGPVQCPQFEKFVALRPQLLQLRFRPGHLVGVLPVQSLVGRLERLDLLAHKRDPLIDGAQ